MIFSTKPDVVDIWRRHTAQIVRWGSALFFASTIAFGIPSLKGENGLFEEKAIARGAALAVVAVVGKSDAIDASSVGKFSVGCFASPLSYNSCMKVGVSCGKK